MTKFADGFSTDIFNGRYTTLVIQQKPHESQLNQERCWYCRQAAKAKSKAKPRNVQFCRTSWVPRALFCLSLYLSETCEIQRQSPKTVRMQTVFKMNIMRCEIRSPHSPKLSGYDALLQRMLVIPLQL